jgi:hypothetical protein
MFLTAGPVAYFTTGVNPPARWSRPYLDERSGVSLTSLTSLPPRGCETEAREGVDVMTPTERDQTALRRGQAARDRAGRRLSLPVDARRRLTAAPADGARDQTTHRGPDEHATRT